MKQVPMSPGEFALIESQLQQANPEEGITVKVIDPNNPTNGNICGTHPIKWSADFTYANGSLTIIGHGLKITGIPQKVESGLVERLNAALAAMRSPEAA